MGVTVTVIVKMKKTAEESTVRMFVLMFTPMAVVIVTVLAVSSDQLRLLSLGGLFDAAEIGFRQPPLIRLAERHLLAGETRVEGR